MFEHGLGGTDCYGVGPEQVLAILSECGLRVSLMTRWLKGLPAPKPIEFFDEYYQARNYYFLAHE